MLQSQLLSGNARLEQAANGPPSIRKRPPDDDADAVSRIQKGLARLGARMPRSFPGGPSQEPDGLYGPETENAVRDFQKGAFPGSMSEWDGRCGPNTLAKLDQALRSTGPKRSLVIPGVRVLATTRCRKKMSPDSGAGAGPRIATGARPAIRPLRHS